LLKNLLFISVADPDPGSGAFLTLDPDPGSGIGFFPDLGSRIPTPYFLLQHLKNKIIFNFVKFVATKKGLTTIFFSFVAVFGSGIRDKLCSKGDLGQTGF
jgi:hypothetical protein